MRKILFLNACVRPQSRTCILAKHVLSKLQGTVEEINLEQAGIKPLNWAALQEREACVRNKDFSAPMLQYARQFAEADEIVIAAPYWDFSFPSTVKIYFEAVTVNGLSFVYTSEGIPKGLCKAKRIFYITTAGGAIGKQHLGYDYVKTLAQNLYGIPEVLCYQAENLDIAGANVNAIMQKAIEQIKIQQ